jgi:hypothetical protein
LPAEHRKCRAAAYLECHADAITNIGFKRSLADNITHQARPVRQIDYREDVWRFKTRHSRAAHNGEAMDPTFAIMLPPL